MKGLAPRLPREAAWQRLARGSVWRRLLIRLNGRPDAVEPVSRTSKLPLLEIAWLPTYRVQFAAEHAGRSLNFDALVNANSGHVVLGDLSRAERCEIEAFSPEQDLLPGRASELARAAVVKNLLTRRGWGQRPKIVASEPPELIGYPVWAYYFATRTGMLDAKLLDAMSGAAGGPQLKTSLLATLAARQRNRKAEE